MFSDFLKLTKFLVEKCSKKGYNKKTKEVVDMKGKTKLLGQILIVVGAIAAVAGIAFAVYKFFIKDDYDDFDEDLYFDDDDIADLLEDEKEKTE